MLKEPMTHRFPVFLVLVFSLAGQTPEQVVANPQMKTAIQSIRINNAWTIQQQVSICEIAAPPFHEAERGKEFARRLTTLGLQDVHKIGRAHV